MAAPHAHTPDHAPRSSHGAFPLPAAASPQALRHVALPRPGDAVRRVGEVLLRGAFSVVRTGVLTSWLACGLGGHVRVLGVDPGLTRCGLGVVEGQVGRPLRMVAVDVVRTSAGSPTAERLHAVQTAVVEWLDQYAPDAVAVERVFSQHNVRTVMGTAQASGVALACAAGQGLPVALYTPSEVKAAVTGSGRADKAQVGSMVGRVLRLTEVPRPADAADALALAICHVWRGAASARLEAAAARTKAQVGAAR